MDLNIHEMAAGALLQLLPDPPRRKESLQAPILLIDAFLRRALESSSPGNPAERYPELLPHLLAEPPDVDAVNGWYREFCGS